MKKILLITFLFLSFAIACHSQQINQIGTRCPIPNRTTYSFIIAQVSGDIVYTPCPTKSSIFTGIVDFTNATVIGGGGGGVISGSGTANFIPRWTGASSLGNTPFSWNGTSYAFNKTVGVTNNFNMTLTPDQTGGAGAFYVGGIVSRPHILLDDSQNALIGGGAAFGAFNPNNGVSFIGDFSGASSNTGITVNATTPQILLDSRGGTTTIGDVASIGNHSKITVTDSFSKIDIQAAGTTTAGDAANMALVLNSTTHVAELANFATGSVDLVMNGTTGVAQFDGNVETIIGGNNSSIRAVISGDKLQTNLSTWDLSDVRGAGYGVNTFNYTRTVTAAGTVGAQTINKPLGTVNFAAGATTIVVTNSTVSATSLIFCTVQSNDATAVGCRVTDKGASAFTIRLPAAATAETSVAFIVTN